MGAEAKEAIQMARQARLWERCNGFYKEGLPPELCYDLYKQGMERQLKDSH